MNSGASSALLHVPFNALSPKCFDKDKTVLSDRILRKSHFSQFYVSSLQLILPPCVKRCIVTQQAELYLFSEVTSSMTSPGSTASLNRKSRKLSKLFGKKKKKLEALEDDDMRAGTSPISEGGQVAPSSENSAKVKRSRSFKKLIKSKKKTEDL